MQNMLFVLPQSAQFLTRIWDKWLDDGADFVHTALPKLIVIGVGSWILIRMLNAGTRRLISVAVSHEGNTPRIAQLRTLASVVRATGIGIIAFVATLEILPLLGVDLKPLLASAGVAGVALGLAAQTIVKDVLNGILLVVEDQFQVGDVVTLAGITGTVEEFTLRRTTVRGFDGTLYTIPNSQITNVANQSRDYSVTTLTISVDFSANPDDVVALLKKIANDVRNDPAYKDVFLADPGGAGCGRDQGLRGDLPGAGADEGTQAVCRRARDSTTRAAGAGREEPVAGQPLPCADIDFGEPATFGTSAGHLRRQPRIQRRIHRKRRILLPRRVSAVAG